ncbi:hypothetical protein C1X73_37805, partial [Pseudomonas sp. FW305-130]
MCLTLDRLALSDALILETGDLAMGASFLETRPHLFSDVAVFINASQLAGMRRIIAAIETVARHPDYLAATMD